MPVSGQESVPNSFEFRNNLILTAGPAVPGDNLEPTRYRITVRGRLTKRLMSAFEGMDVDLAIEQTVLVGKIRDQSHLYGVLALVREMGLDLVSVETDRGTLGPDDEESARLEGQCGAVQP